MIAVVGLVIGVVVGLVLQPTVPAELQPYLPYSNVQDGQYLGYGRDLLDAFAAHQGHEFIYQPLPVRRWYLPASCWRW